MKTKNVMIVLALILASSVVFSFSIDELWVSVFGGGSENTNEQQDLGNVQQYDIEVQNSYAYLGNNGTNQTNSSEDESSVEELNIDEDSLAGLSDDLETFTNSMVLEDVKIPNKYYGFVYINEEDYNGKPIFINYPVFSKSEDGYTVTFRISSDQSSYVTADWDGHPEHINMFTAVAYPIAWLKIIFKDKEEAFQMYKFFQGAALYEREIAIGFSTDNCKDYKDSKYCFIYMDDSPDTLDIADGKYIHS